MATHPFVRKGSRARAVVFAIAMAIGLFGLASFVYLRHASADFIIARRERLLPIYATGDLVSWQRQAPGQLEGWSRPEPGGTWTIGPAAAFAVRIPEPHARDLELRATVAGVMHPVHFPRRDVFVAVNGTPVARWRFDEPYPVLRTARIPSSAIAGSPTLRVDFSMTEHRSPHALRIGRDTRSIGMLLVEWQFVELPAGDEGSAAIGGGRGSTAGLLSPRSDQTSP